MGSVLSAVPSSVQTFDDGTTITYAVDGSVMNYTDTSGHVFRPDASVGRDYVGAFLDTVAKGFNAKLRDAFNPAPIRASAMSAPAASSSGAMPSWLKVVLGAAAIALAVKFVRG